MMRFAKNRRARGECLAGNLFVLPANLLLFTFTLLPVAISLVLAFLKYNGFAEPEWVGLSNFIKLFRDRDFAASMKNTLLYVLLTVPAQTILSLALAAVLAAKFRNAFGEFTRGTLFIPVLCSAVLAGTVFYYLFASSGDAAVNMVLSMFGIPKVNWLGERRTALLVVAIVGVWRDVGYYTVIFYAGIMDIPRNYYEAARVDGASGLQQFFGITLPCLQPILYLVVTLGTIWSFQVFDVPYIMTQGGPGNATMSPVMLIYNAAFSSRRMGYASAMACVLAVVIFVVSIIQRRLFHAKVGGEE